MNDVIKIALGFVGCGSIAAIAYFFLSKSVGTKTSITKAIHDLIQKKVVERVKKVEGDQILIKVGIDQKEELAEESKKKIKDIQKKAAEEIYGILKEDDVVKIHKEIEEEWKEL